MKSRLIRMAEEWGEWVDSTRDASIIKNVSHSNSFLAGVHAALEMAAEACEQVRLSFPIAGAGIEVLRKYDACQACETAIRALMESDK